MTVYVIARIDIQDRDEYGKYESGFMEIFARYNGTMLAVDEAPEVVEGTWGCTRTVLIEFPNREDMQAWYASDAYQTLAAHRFRASRGDIVTVHGLGG